ncbi:hypothetical protein [Megasphaera massiliensis]|uniref:hypothetical protein n=1 Tax=Megasphaera massiliensis TaxID=1232428 RepID=UPI0005C98C26|nr:hypothetical protein [Megasphaera massiliensis]
MEFIGQVDITDNILTCRDSDIAYANAYLHRLAVSFGLSDDEIQLPPSIVVQQLGKAIACRECAAAMVGSDTTVMVDGSRSEDIYYQKYKMYVQLAKDLESRLTYKDMAIDGIDGSGKGGVGVIRLSRG